MHETLSRTSTFNMTNNFFFLNQIEPPRKPEGREASPSHSSRAESHISSWEAERVNSSLEPLIFFSSFKLGTVTMGKKPLLSESVYNIFCNN